MNDNRMKRWMDAIDDDLLEEAQRPLPRSGAARRWGALAACFCAAALALALWQPWSAGIGDNTAGADADFGAMDKSFPSPCRLCRMPSCSLPLWPCRRARP